jgi:hypothetical protein
MNKIIASILILLAAVVTAGAADNSSAKTSLLIKEAKARHLSYVIESAIMTVRLDSATNTTTTKITDVEITYSLLALATVTNFDEEYHAMTPEAEVFRIHGSEPESDLDHPTPGRKAWNVLLHLHPGQRQTIVTAARYIYPQGLPARRTIRNFPNLNPTEDVYCYPNSEDIIGDLTIRIESPLPIKTPLTGEALLAGMGTNVSSPKILSLPISYPADTPGKTPWVLTAGWNHIVPGKIAELKIRR